MAKTSVNIAQQCKEIIDSVKAGRFAPVYLLMGDEPYYPELVCQAIIDNCLQDFEKDFNETICYGPDVSASQIVTTARRFPMMAERQLPRSPAIFCSWGDFAELEEAVPIQLARFITVP